MGKTNDIILQTNNFKTIFNACEDALLNQNMVVISGKTGYGKTTGIEWVKSKYGNCVVIISVRKSMNPRLFFSSIFNEIIDDNYKPSLQIYFSINKAASVFKNQSRNMLLIIDEAGRLAPTMFQYLHELRELTKENTGIVLIGIECLKNNLESWNTKGHDGIPEFYGRINAFQTLNRPTYEEIVAMNHANNIFDKKFISECRNVDNFRELNTMIKNYLKLKKPKSDQPD